MIRRRSFLTLLGGAAAGWPVVARAQQGERMRRVGLLVSGTSTDPEMQARNLALAQELERLGWSEGRNLQIDYRFGDSLPSQYQAFAKELVALRLNLFVAQTTPVVEALRKESRTVPIVFITVSDPIGSGFIKTLARPGGNLTGVMLYEEGITGKWLAMLKEIAPHLERAALVANPKTTAYDYFVQSAKATAQSLAIQLVPTPIENISTIERAIESFARLPNGGLILPPDATTTLNRDLVIAVAARHRLPAVYPWRLFVESGGLMSYGVNNVDQYRQAASYVDRILRGANPADLPVQTPSKYETTVNLKTAKALNLAVPPSLLVRADEVIE